MNMTKLVVHLFTTAISLSRKMALEVMSVDDFDADLEELDREMGQYVDILTRLVDAMYAGRTVVTAELAVKAVSFPSYDRGAEQIRIHIDDHEDGAEISLSWAYSGLQIELDQVYDNPPKLRGCWIELGDGKRFPVTGKAKEFMVRFLTELGPVIEENEIALDKLDDGVQFQPMSLDVALREGLRKLNQTKTVEAYKELEELYRLAAPHAGTVEEVDFARRALVSMRDVVHA